MVGGLEQFVIFPYIGNSNPNWLSYFSEGLKPPTSNGFIPSISTPKDHLPQASISSSLAASVVQKSNVFNDAPQKFAVPWVRKGGLIGWLSKKLILDDFGNDQ